MREKKKIVVFIVLLLIVGIIAGYQLEQYKGKNAAGGFFNVGQSVSSVKQKDFFDYGVDKNTQVKSHDI